MLYPTGGASPLNWTASVELSPRAFSSVWPRSPRRNRADVHAAPFREGLGSSVEGDVVMGVDEPSDIAAWAHATTVASENPVLPEQSQPTQGSQIGHQRVKSTCPDKGLGRGKDSAPQQGPFITHRINGACGCPQNGCIIADDRIGRRRRCVWQRIRGWHVWSFIPVGRVKAGIPIARLISSIRKIRS